LSFPGGSAGKESACHVGDLGSIPGLGRSPGEGNGFPYSMLTYLNGHSLSLGITQSLPDSCSSPQFPFCLTYSSVTSSGSGISAPESCWHFPLIRLGALLNTP